MKGIDYKADGLAAKWDRSRRLARVCLRAPQNLQASEQVCALEDAVLREPIQSLEDAIAKLHAVALLFIDGERTDGADEAALNQAIQWLEGRRGHGDPPCEPSADRRVRRQVGR